MTRALFVILALTATTAAHPPDHDRIPRPKHRRPPTFLAPGERLPRLFVPNRYRMRLSVEDKLVGAISIDGTVATAAPVVWLDFHGTITAAEAKRGEELVALDVTATGDRVALVPPSPLGPGAWSIEMTFTSQIIDNGTVVLPADGVKRDPQPEQMAEMSSHGQGAFREIVDGAAYTFTQSEPMDARRIFPCFDEPDLKVPWQLSLDVDEALLAASNAPILRETPLPEHRKRVEFEPTQPLPSYLVAFAVGPFDAIDAGVAKSGTHVRILETRGHKAGWAAATAARVLDLLAAWTGVPYGYPKLDLVAVPRTGPMWAAMENPGLVTFADWVIRGDDSRDQKREWIAIAAHEFAHQWFGDLVTMAWWNDIWLNESFAVYFARAIATQFDPAYDVPAELAYRDLVDTARPPADSTMFLPYFIGGRGARAIAMFAELLGPAKFRAAIHGYLTAHAHGNATTADLGAALSHEYGAPLGDALVAALDQPGLPRVTVEPACGSIQIEASAPTPVCLAYEQDGKRATACLLVDHKRASLPVASCPRWVVPNADSAMRYTSHRSADELAATSFGWDLLSRPERAALLDETGPDVALALRLVDAPDARAWAAETLAKAARLAPIAPWLRKHYLARARKLHFDPQDREDAAVLAAIAQAGDPELEREAVELVKDLRHVHTDVIGAVVTLALRADPSLAPLVQKELSHAFFERRFALLRALPADAPGIAGSDRLVMLAHTCDPARRAEAQQLALGMSDEVNPILHEFNACLDWRSGAIEALRSITAR